MDLALASGEGVRIRFISKHLLRNRAGVFWFSRVVITKARELEDSISQGGGMRATNRVVRLAILQALACTSGLLLTTPGMAHADPAHFDIGPQPLPDALRNFATQAKMQLLYRYHVVRNAIANPVTGQLEKHAALEQ